MESIETSEKHAKAAEQTCPRCSSLVPVHSEYVTWCDRCGWNLQPYLPNRPRTVFESFYASMGKKLSRNLFDTLAKTDDLKAGWTPAKVLAFAIAALVHAFTLSVVALGSLLIIRGWPHVILLALGVLCLGVAWVIR